MHANEPARMKDEFYHICNVVFKCWIYQIKPGASALPRRGLSLSFISQSAVCNLHNRPTRYLH